MKFTDHELMIINKLIDSRLWVNHCSNNSDTAYNELLKELSRNITEELKGE